MLRVGNCILSGLGSLVGLLAGGHCLCARGALRDRSYCLRGCTFAGAVCWEALLNHLDRSEAAACRAEALFGRSATQIAIYAVQVPPTEFLTELAA